MKICKDCKFSAEINRASPLCMREGAKRKVNLVTGEVDRAYCEVERRNYETIETCGSEGKFWEAKDENVA